VFVLVHALVCHVYWRLRTAAQFIAAKDPDGVAEMVVPVQEGGQGMTYLFKVRGFLSFLQISTCMAH
jgi:hypothetical protein